MISNAAAALAMADIFVSSNSSKLLATKNAFRRPVTKVPLKAVEANADIAAKGLNL